jgi:hypothetical protein
MVATVAESDPLASQKIQTSPSQQDEDDDSVDSLTFQNTKSDCGFGDTLHEAIMMAGKAVHKIVGEPNELVGSIMKETGDFVRDTAVALHDFRQADASVVQEETNELIKYMTSKEEEESPGEEHREQPVA